MNAALCCLSLKVFLLVLFVCVYNVSRFFEYDMSCYSAASSSSSDDNDTANLNTSDTSANDKDCRGELVKNLILIHPAVWTKHKWAKNWGSCAPICLG